MVKFNTHILSLFKQARVLTPRSVRRVTKFSNGLTLVELLIGMVVVALIVGAGIPGLSGLFNSMSSRSNADLLARSIVFARQTAVSTAQPISICASIDSSNCSAATDWDEGWLIFEDISNDGVLDIGETIIKTANISASEALIASNVASITFNERGESTNAAAVDMRVCGKDSNVDAVRIIQIATTGSMTNRGFQSGDSCI